MGTTTAVADGNLTTGDHTPSSAAPSFMPGPWSAIFAVSYLDEEKQWMVPGVAHCGNGECAEANARLIAEAPNMLRALSAAAGYLTNARIDLETGATKRTAIQTIDGGLKVVNEAIAKAQGR